VNTPAGTSASDEAARYGRVAIGLHWAVAAAIFCTFPLGLYMADLPLSPRKLQLVSYHKWIGITVLALACVRLAWRLTHRPPALPASVQVWQRRAAALAHGTLYGLIIAIPLTGWLYSSALGVPTLYFRLWQLPDVVGRDKALAEALKLAHQTLNFMLLAMVVVHVAAALKHQFVERDGLLLRMLPWRRYLGSSGSAGSARR
jgi:cytochrome b561